MKLPQDMKIESINGTPLDPPVIVRNALFTPVEGATHYHVYGAWEGLPATITVRLQSVTEVMTDFAKAISDMCVALEQVKRQDRFRFLMRLRNRRRA